jgi:CHAD domain-containing protein
MRKTVEREIKLCADKGFVLPELGAPLPERLFVSTYYDAPDLRLARSGVTLRHRIEGGAGLWQLKLPHGASRIELELPGPPAHPPVEMLDLLVAHLRGQAPVPVARMRTRRETVRVNGAEIVEDSVAVLDGVHVTRRFRELEVELLEGDEETLRRLEKQLRRAGATDAGQVPKLYRALELAGPVEPHVVPADATPREALAIAIREQARRMLVHDPGARLGEDIEDLHQLRVATRRLRAFLRAARPIVDRDWVEGLRGELAWLGSALGPARDLDVLVERLQGDAAALDQDAEAGLHLLDDLERERAAARAAVLEALSSDRYLALLDRLQGTAVDGVPPGEADVTLRALAAEELRRARRAAAKLPAEPPDDELHALRIRAKRVRYALELAGHELGKRGARAVRAAKDVQDVLGDHQDSTVAEARVRALALEHPEWGVAAGRIVERERVRRAAARAAWRDTWRRFERRARAAVA